MAIPNKSIGDRGARANGLVTDHSPDRGFCESLLLWRADTLSVRQSVKPFREKLQSKFIKSATKLHGSASPTILRLLVPNYNQVAGRCRKSVQDVNIRGKNETAVCVAVDKITCILEPELTDKALRKNWARLIQKTGACPGHDLRKSSLLYAPNVRLK